MVHEPATRATEYGQDLVADCEQPLEPGLPRTLIARDNPIGAYRAFQAPALIGLLATTGLG